MTQKETYRQRAGAVGDGFREGRLTRMAAAGSAIRTDPHTPKRVRTAAAVDPQKARQDPAATGCPLALTVFPVAASRSGADAAVADIAAVVNGLVWDLSARK